MDNQETKMPENTKAEKKSRKTKSLRTAFKVIAALILTLIVSCLAVLHFMPGSTLAFSIDGFVEKLSDIDFGKSDESVEVEEIPPIEEETIDEGKAEEEKTEDAEEQSEEEEKVNNPEITYITEDMIVGEWITEDGDDPPVVFLDNGKALITNMQGERTEWEWWVYEDKVFYRRTPESKVWFYYYSPDTDSLSYEEWPHLVRK